MDVVSYRVRVDIPQNTILYRVVQRYLETYLPLEREHD